MSPSIAFARAARAASDKTSAGSSSSALPGFFAVLEVLLHMGALPVNAIGERVLLTSGSITTAVQRLEKKGLLQRERSRLDARVVLVQLTSAGQDLIESNSSQHAGNLEDLFVEFSEEERVQFENLITKFHKRVRVLSK